MRIAAKKEARTAKLKNNVILVPICAPKIFKVSGNYRTNVPPAQVNKMNIYIRYRSSSVIYENEAINPIRIH